jgi:restriction system protein
VRTEERTSSRARGHSWSGFKSNVQQEMAPSFFRVRLRSRDDVLQQLFDSYDKLDEDLRAELPLKRIRTVAARDED